MFNLTQRMLEILMVLSKAEGWPVFIQEFKQVRDDNMEDVLHFNPSSEDVNARQRQDLLRGVAVCLDVLYHAFENPLEILEDIKVVERITKNEEIASS